MNILGYIRQHGESNVAELVVTVADCLSSKDFQEKWHSFRTGFIRKRFPSGMWTRERQPRSGNWHAHCVVNVGRDIRSGFPIAEVEARDYRHVALWIRELWRELREGSERYGFGRISLMPIKKTGPAAAKYFVKYLAKSHGSSKLLGEERCRLFGTWGAKRWCYPKFSWVSGRIFRKRLSWCATALRVPDVENIADVLGRDWWMKLREPLLRVVLPVEYYQIRDDSVNGFRFDDLGIRAYCNDLGMYPHVPTIYRKERLSQFLFYLELGKTWGIGVRRACAFARRLLERNGLGYQQAFPLAYLPAAAKPIADRKGCAAVPS